MLDIAAFLYVLEKGIGFAFLAVLFLLMGTLGICHLIDKARSKRRAAKGK